MLSYLRPLIDSLHGMDEMLPVNLGDVDFEGWRRFLYFLISCFLLLLDGSLKQSVSIFLGEIDRV